MPKDFRRYIRRKHDYRRRKAKEEGYLSRAAYKLKQINQRFKLIKPGQRILELGASPGGRTQVLSELVGEEGEVVAVDLRKLKFSADNVRFIRSDIRELDVKSLGKFDLVVSDLAPNTSGHYSLDQAKQLRLVLEAYKIAKETLKPGGAFISKVFYGEDVEDLVKEMRKEFKFVRLYKPKASRSESAETYIVAVGYQRVANKSDKEKRGIKVEK